ncbi:UxaA family hydrolase [Agathobaculum sp.]|uniref:UxaA family hydrolase n=1 Tax=Agathobaculum sp. TaxID=2048138 RepID=UPI002A7F78D9|nr:UxaA family hydrolase [Agathobaculum sp.]MDY3617614.1 UxaA family hydrolase [Agathobaculum sp.]
MYHCIQVDARDNVAVAVHALAAGDAAASGLTALEPIPQGHKIALRDIGEGDPVVRYGVCLGHALRSRPRGSLVGEHDIRAAAAPPLDRLVWGTDLVSKERLPAPPAATFEGFRNAEGFAGTRNLLGIVTTVQCAAGVAEQAAQRIRERLLPLYPRVEDVVVLVPPYGCGVAIDAPEAKVPIRTIRNLIHHPNFGGQILVVSLGCEKLTPERVLEPDEITPENRLVLQECRGFEAMVSAICRMAEPKLRRLNERKREPLPLSQLMVGLQCGGSDAFSGLTGNPAAGYAADMLVRAGATVLFSETTEVRDGAHLLAARTPDAETCARLAEEMRWYDRYLAAGGVDRSANPTPGNKKGGLSNIVEKAVGSIAKSGSSPIVEVIGTGERPRRQGLIYAATPANDMICGTSQCASGIGLQVFITGRGTPYNMRAVPVVKVGTRTDLKEQWFDLIDIDAGTIATGRKSVAEVGSELFRCILEVASGKRQTFADLHGIYNDTYVFNPAPIT